MKSKVFAKLKPKAASLGFNREELEGVAADIATNLNSEDATDEDIDARIDAAIPFLKVAQKATNRVIEESRKKATPDSTQTDATKSTDQLKSGSETPQDAEPAWFKAHRESQEKRLASLEARETGKTRRSDLEKALEGSSDAFKAKALKDFNRMNFESDDAFLDYIEETKQDAETFKQETADKGLAGMGKPAGGGQAPKTDIDPVVKERIAERQAETVAPAIVGLPQTK